jgi:hypothetical protein
LLFDGLKPMVSNSETREQFLYQNIINNWEKNTFIISINGFAHINKYYLQNELILGNRKSIGYLLNTSQNSPFYGRVKSIGIVNFYLKSSKLIEKVRNSVYFMSKEEKKHLYSLCKSKIQCIKLDSLNFKIAYKAYDLLILVDTAHSFVQRNF